jgi:hypothetical protein
VDLDGRRELRVNVDLGVPELQTPKTMRARATAMTSLLNRREEATVHRIMPAAEPPL